MIALERDMPRQCLYDNCPCMQTVTAEEWMTFRKPSWCPLIKIEETKEELAFDREFESHWY